MQKHQGGFAGIGQIVVWGDPLVIVVYALDGDKSHRVQGVLPTKGHSAALFYWNSFY
jgi:hypothetical protein